MERCINLVDEHWYPIVWKWIDGELQAFTCGHAFGRSLAVSKLHQLMSCKRCFESLSSTRHPSCKGNFTLLSENGKFRCSSLGFLAQSAG